MRKKWYLTILLVMGMLLLGGKKASAAEYTVDMTILKTGTSEKSAASSFIQQAAITVEDNQVTQVAVHVDASSSAAKSFLAMAKKATSQVVKGVSLQGVKGKKTNLSKDGNSFDLIFDKKVYLLKANPGILTVDLSMNGTTFSEKADYYFAPWQEGVKKAEESSTSQSSQKATKTTSQPKKTQTRQATAPNTLSYRVYKSDQSGLSIADSYYTHQAAVAKQGSRYLVTMTVKVKSGIATFTPVSMGGQAVVNTRHYQQGGYDYWQYGFYLTSLAKKQLAGQIKMSVPIANISNQLFSVIFKFSPGSVNSSTSSAAAPATSADTSSEADTSTDQITTSDPATVDSADSEETTSTPEAASAAVSQSPSQSKTVQAIKEARAGVRKVKAAPAGTLAQQELAEYPYLPLILILSVANLTGLGGLGYYLYKRKFKKHD
ncbi:NEAT domain-containing protein [Lactobacillus sp.]|uniref:NEAT domain-containing protein n=1 Tax=Lactobacillus sp. TaxID=1591 RepID=UPI003EFA00D4